MVCWKVMCNLNKRKSRDFPDSPVLRTMPFNAGGAALTRGQGAKIPHCLTVKNTKHKTDPLLTNSVKTLKMVHILKKNLKEEKLNMVLEDGGRGL